MFKGISGRISQTVIVTARLLLITNKKCYTLCHIRRKSLTWMTLKAVTRYCG